MLRVLTYHRIAELNSMPELNPRMISATPAAFEQQMRFVARHYRAVGMEEVLEAAERRRELAGKPLMITFDDAYRDFAETALPILQRYRLPVTLFVPTAFPDHTERWFWWDKLYCAITESARPQLHVVRVGQLNLQTHAERMTSMKKLQTHIKGMEHSSAMALVDATCEQLGFKPSARKTVLGWSELRGLAKAGVTMGAHTRTHPIMTRLTPAELRDEVAGSWQDLQHEIGEVPPIFCYPAGGHDEMVVQVLREEGIKLAFTTRKGQNDLRRADLLRLRRQNITPRTSLAIFRIRLMRWASYLDAWRHRKTYNPAAIGEMPAAMTSEFETGTP